MTPFSEALHTLRRARGITQKELAEQLNIRPSYISLIESGKRCPPKSPFLTQLIEVLGLTEKESIFLQQKANESQTVFKLPSNLEENEHRLAVEFFGQLGKLSQFQIDLIRRTITQ